LRLLVIYDISSNEQRLKLAEDLKRLGLTRIQRSAFAGVIDSSRMKDLIRICKLRASSDRDVIHIIQLCDYDWKKVSVIGIPWNELESREEGVLIV